MMFVLSSVALAQGGHVVSPDQVTVSEQSHWDKWFFGEGTVDISADGVVSPHFWHKNTNAVLDIVDNLRWNPPEYLEKTAPEDITLSDAITAGSNAADVVNLFDGLMSTYWEPNPPVEGTELPGQWWFTVDLGRIVLADKIVARFVEEGEGDPFLLFDVLVSTGEKPSRATAGQSLNYLPVIQTLRENKTQRVFEADLTSLSSQEEFKRIVRFVQVVVRASDLERGREVTREEYERLRREAPDDVGLVEYPKILLSGGEIAIAKDDYERLEESRRGPIRYFRKERPRLAELEVWGPGDDLAAGVIRRGGSIVNTSPKTVNAQLMIDGDIESGEFMSLSSTVATRLADEVFMDLSSFFWIDSVRMAGGRIGLNKGISWFEYRLQFSDGSRDVSGDLKWETVASRNGERRPIVLQREEFEPVRARFFRLQWDVGRETVGSDKLGEAHLSEIQLYGRGYQPEVAGTSDLIRLGRTRNLSTIEWDAHTPSGTQVVVQTRTGNTLDTLLHYYKADGTEISEAQYNAIRVKSQRGDIVPEQVASEDWEPWSEPYKVPAGSAITSPSPSEFLRIRATLQSDDPDKHPSLSEIRLNHSTPVASRLVGAVLPTRVDSLGVGRLFSLFVEVDSLDVGFDELVLLPPHGMKLAFDSLRESLYAGRSSDFEDADLAGLVMSDVQVLAQGDSLHLAFPAVESDVEAVRVDFHGVLYSTGGRLQALLRNSEGEGVWQRVDESVPGSSLQLVAQPERKELFLDLAIPRVFSPNGDGINDEFIMQFTVVLLGSSTAVEAEIFDLSGRRVRRLTQQWVVSTGRYSIPWDGRDDADDLLPPGLYAVRLSLDTDTKGTGLDRSDVLRALTLVY